jgi:N-acetylglucosaminyldiphosphoundecaprenol N-acetyl-beta-D-mannosaminyltransferase
MDRLIKTKKADSSGAEKVRLFDIDFDALDFLSVIKIIDKWIQSGRKDCPYVVTPNVDHVVKLNRNATFMKAYRKASLVVVDGKPVLLAARLLGKHLPETVPGSDLIPALFEHFNCCQRELRVFLLGTLPRVLEKATVVIENSWPYVKVIGAYSPPLGFEQSESECSYICSVVSDAQPDMLVLGLGAPKQELWISQFAERLPVSVALCVGATIDFIAREKPRAPLWMREYGLEWFHRLFSEPRRLLGRYVYDACVFPQLFLREWLSRFRE